MRTHPLSAKAIQEVRKAKAAGFTVEFLPAPKVIDATSAKLGMVKVAQWAIDERVTVTLDANGGLGRITKTEPIRWGNPVTSSADVRRECGYDDEIDDYDPARDGPPPGSWAAVARVMADGDDSGTDWDAWKDEMKERDL